MIITFQTRFPHLLQRSPKDGETQLITVSALRRATGGTSITNIDADGGFVNKAAMFDDDDDGDGDKRYTKLQARSGGDGTDGPPDTFATAESYSPAATPTEPPPEYTRHPTYMEVVDDSV